jgi:hypothetical protein
MFTGLSGNGLEIHLLDYWRKMARKCFCILELVVVVVVDVGSVAVGMFGCVFCSMRINFFRGNSCHFYIHLMGYSNTFLYIQEVIRTI